MKVSLSWLKDYISIETETNKLADALTMVGLEVETVSDRYDYLRDVCVGRVVKIISHPNADKLSVCTVDIGNRTIPVICGAPNVQENILVPVALPGSMLVDGTTVEKGTIRGEASEGMLCSEAGLGLGSDKSGIMILNNSLSTGKKIAGELKLSDPVFDIDLTPNRPDCLSIIGIAREIAALQKNSIKYPDVPVNDSGNRIAELTSVTIQNPDQCPRYAARLLDNITVAPSPFWLQDRLMSVGLRPINNIVDITNFVMMETGQPLHAFDFDRLAGNRIVVRTANKGEKFITLDQKERSLSPDMLMICDGEKPVALAGIMGGSNSEIENHTNRVLIESAYFDPVSIRKTSKYFGLNTEASHRFERGVDPEGTLTALNRASVLMADVSSGNLISGVIDEHPRPITRQKIPLSIRDTNRLLGTRLRKDEIEDFLKSIEFIVEKDKDVGDGDKMVVLSPSFRVDIRRPVDLMEEVARLSGYNNIPTTFPLISAENRLPLKETELRNRVKHLMIGFGFMETVNYSFINKFSCDRLNLGSDDRRRNLVHILNPLTEDQAVMRTSLIPSLLENMHFNLAQQVKSLKLFEVGNIYLNTNQNNLPEEIEMIAGIWTGARHAPSWHSQETDCDFYDIKGVVEGLFKGLNIDNFKQSQSVFTGMPDLLCDFTEPDKSAQIFVDKESVGLVGKVAPQVLHNYDLLQPAYVFELNLKLLATLIPDIPTSEPIPKFPAASRDITLIIDKNIESRAILESINRMGEELLENVFLFDVFEGDPIPAGKKSISFRLTYRSETKTLEDDQINHIHKTITDRIVKAFAATLPA